MFHRPPPTLGRLPRSGMSVRRTALVAFVLGTWGLLAAGCGADQEPASTTTTLDATEIAIGVADAIVGDGSLVDAKAASCTAEKIQNDFGARRLYDLGFRSGGVLGGKEFLSLGWTQVERDAVHSYLLGCVDQQTVITKLVVDTAPAGQRDAASCVAAVVLANPSTTKAVIIASLESDQKALDKNLSVLTTACLAPTDVRVVVPPALTTPVEERVPGEDLSQPTSTTVG